MSENGSQFNSVTDARVRTNMTDGRVRTVNNYNATFLLLLNIRQGSLPYSCFVIQTIAGKEENCHGISSTLPSAHPRLNKTRPLFIKESSPAHPKLISGLSMTLLRLKPDSSPTRLKWNSFLLYFVQSVETLSEKYKVVHFAPVIFLFWIHFSIPQCKQGG